MRRQVGQIVGGKVRRVETFGVFVDVAGCRTSGLAHVSELSDGKKIKEASALFRPGQAVKAKVGEKEGRMRTEGDEIGPYLLNPSPHTGEAGWVVRLSRWPYNRTFILNKPYPHSDVSDIKVLRIDLEAGKLSLGMKPSYLLGEDEEDEEDKDGPKGKRAKLPDIDGEAADMEEEEEEEDVEEDEEGEEGEEEEEEEGDDSDEDVDDVSEAEEDEEEDSDADDGEDGDAPRGAPPGERRDILLSLRAHV